jgi:hypothetical protein
MLHCLKSLLSHPILAADGPIGTLADFYFDDSLWTVRYLVVDIGRFLRGHKVLISPVAIAGTDWPGKSISLKHSIEQIKNSPDIDVDKPVYRQLEEQLTNYYGWVGHWTPQRDLPEPQPIPTLTGDTHLRSVNNVCKYVVMAFDGRVGSITDLIVAHDGWQIPYLVLDTKHYLPVDQVVIPAQRIKGIRVEDKEISIDMNKAEVAKAPPLDERRELDDYLKSGACVEQNLASKAAALTSGAAAVTEPHERL